MDSINITSARQNLYQLVKETNESYKPIRILGKNGNAVLISEDDWNAIEETLHLNSIPNMVNDIIDGSKTPVEECTPADEVDW